MRVLAIGAHPDDIEIGCGGALAAHRQAGDSVAMLVMTNGAQGPGDVAGRIAEQQAAAAVLDAELYWGRLADCAIAADQSTIMVIENLLSVWEPDIIYTHSEADSHQDHVAVARASLAAARNVPSVLCYESPSALTFTPNVYVDVTDSFSVKMAALAEHHSQVQFSARVDVSALEASARYRGAHARCQLAEAFQSVRLTMAMNRVPAPTARKTF